MSNVGKHLYEFGPFRLDADRQRLMREGEPISLPPKAVELLTLLVERQGQVVEKEFLLTALWPDTVVEESNLTQNVYLLRKALGQATDGQTFIETFSKRGYKFAPTVQLAVEDEALIITKHTQARIRITQEDTDTEQPAALPAPQALSLPQPSEAPLHLAESQRRLPILRRQWGLGLVVLVLLVGGSVYFWRVRSGAATIRSVAVLPFKTIGAVDNEPFLGLGMADAVITRLGKTGKLTISPTAAVRRYQEPETDPLTAGRALQVSAGTG
ncbi:MAG: transcriptional regulator [Blastocatellia bacterium]